MARTLRRGSVLFGLTAASALVLSIATSAAPVPTVSPVAHDAYVPGQVIVRYTAGTTRAERAAAVDAAGAASIESLGTARTELLDLDAGVSVAEAIAELEVNPDVAYAEPNYLYEISAIPNDTNFGLLWGLNQATDKDIDAPEAWDITTGSSSVIVAVIDSGVAYDHPDLAPNIWTNDDPAGGGDNDGNGFVDDTRGWDFVQNDNTPLDGNQHGTHVAGTIGARGNNALGITGVNWQVSIMPLRAGDVSGSLTNAAIISAINYACANGARVVNGSFGGSGFSQATLDAISAPACSNVVFSFSAGNGGSDGVGDNNDTTPQYPCNYATTRIICVAATGQTDVRAGFSNFGATSVDLAAPGVGVYSAMPNFTNVLVDGFGGTPAEFGTRWGGQTAPAGHSLWGQIPVSYAGGAPSISDSPFGTNYAANTDTQIRSLTGANLTGKGECSLDYLLNLQAASSDFFQISASTSFGGAYTAVSPPWSGSTGSSLVALTDDMHAFDGQPSVFLKLRLFSNATGEADGALVDDLTLKCVGPSVSPGDYQNLNGTSMAAPHVAGAAALVMARNPALTAAEVRTILLATVDPIASLSGVIATGGRLNLHAAVAAAAPGDTTAPPVPSIDSGPTGTVASAGATFTFSDTEAGVSFECRLDAGAFAACTSPRTLTGLSEGAHSFEVVAKDSSGNTSGSSTRAWSVDTTAPPVPSIDSGPTGTVKSTGATFGFSDSEGGVTFQCRVDAQPFAACLSPLALSGLAQVRTRSKCGQRTPC